MIIDIETTGGSPKNSKITEIAIYKHDGEKVIDEFTSLVNPEIPIPPFIVQLTGINDSMVKTAPKFYEIAKQIIDFTEDCIFVAHNVGFDYGVIRAEFRSLGFDYRREHLCTVRTARYVLPGHDSYSLGKLTRSLGIELVGRHRAGGDAFATAQLFTLLMQKDPNKLANFIQKEVNPKRLHPNLDVNELDEIPNKTGVYKFFNEDNKLIYIGKSIHIRKRIDQHLRNTKTKKGLTMQKEIARVEFEVTGSELIALLLESSLIKKHLPIYNRSLRRNQFPIGLFHYKDDHGYIRFYLKRTTQTLELPLTNFISTKEGTKFMEQMVEKYNLCTKLCNLYASQSSCFQYELKNCLGACIQEEDADLYNERCQSLIDELSLNEESFYIIDKGRQNNEKSLVLVKNGSLEGYGYAPFHFRGRPQSRWKDFITEIQEDRDARTILKLFLRKNKSHEIVKL